MREMIVLPGGTEVVDAVLGWRCWSVRFDHGEATLYSMVQRDVAWPKGAPLTAVCGAKCERIISMSLDVTELDEHSCGVYAWNYKPNQLIPRWDHLWGEVALWGTVHRHELGYRADHALPLALFMDESRGESERLKIELVALQYSLAVVQLKGIDFGTWVGRAVRSGS